MVISSFQDFQVLEDIEYIISSHTGQQNDAKTKKLPSIHVTD